MDCHSNRSRSARSASQGTGCESLEEEDAVRRSSVRDVKASTESNEPTNPYSSSSETPRRIQLGLVRISTDRGLVFWSIALGLVVLSSVLPTIELHKGDRSLGRAPVFMAYVAFFMPEYQPLALLIVMTHLGLSFGVAWIVFKLLGLWDPMLEASERGDSAAPFAAEREEEEPIG